MTKDSLGCLLCVVLVSASYAWDMTNLLFSFLPCPFPASSLFLPQMSLSLNYENANHKNQLVAGLATLLAKDCANVTADAIDSAAKKSGNALPAGYAAVYASFASKHDSEKLCPALGGGGGAAAPAAAGAPAAAKVEAPKEEEVDPMEGGMDMFGGGGGGGDY
jgi:hypothetical protein